MTTATISPRAEPVVFHLEDMAEACAIKPPTRAAVRRAMKLDETGANDDLPHLRSRRLADRLAALVGPHCYVWREGAPGDPIDSSAILRRLTPGQEGHILSALLAGGLGESAPSGTKRRTEGKVTDRARMLGEFDADSIALAVHLQITRSAAEQIEFAESLDLLGAIYAERNARSRWEAALHGVRI